MFSMMFVSNEFFFERFQTIKKMLLFISDFVNVKIINRYLIKWRPSLLHRERFIREKHANDLLTILSFLEISYFIFLSILDRNEWKLIELGLRLIFLWISQIHHEKENNLIHEENLWWTCVRFENEFLCTTNMNWCRGWQNYQSLLLIWSCFVRFSYRICYWCISIVSSSIDSVVSFVHFHTIPISDTVLKHHLHDFELEPLLKWIAVNDVDEVTDNFQTNLGICRGYLFLQFSLFLVCRACELVLNQEKLSLPFRYSRMCVGFFYWAYKSLRFFVSHS